MKNRTMPYGYELRDGKCCVSRSEAEIVTELFTAYTHGASYKELAEHMAGRGVPYHDGDTVWSKNKVARILNCAAYLGTPEYPALIDRSLYDAAMARKPVYAKSEETGRVKAIREMSRCGCCGGRIRMSARREGWVRWNCADCGALGAKATTENIVPQVEATLTSLIRGELAIVEPPRKETQVPALTQKESDFAAMLEAEDFDEAAAMTAAMELATARYDRIDSEDYETMRIRHRIEQAAGNTNFDMNLLRDVASEILIQPSGEVDIILKNGQIIGRNGAR